jgi:hypothetical protein
VNFNANGHGESGWNRYSFPTVASSSFFVVVFDGGCFCLPAAPPTATTVAAPGAAAFLVMCLCCGLWPRLMLLLVLLFLVYYLLRDVKNRTGPLLCRIRRHQKRQMTTKIVFENVKLLYHAFTRLNTRSNQTRTRGVPNGRSHFGHIMSLQPVMKVCTKSFRFSASFIKALRYPGPSNLCLQHQSWSSLCGYTDWTGSCRKIDMAHKIRKTAETKPTEGSGPLPCRRSNFLPAKIPATGRRDATLGGNRGVCCINRVLVSYRRIHPNDFGRHDLLINFCNVAEWRFFCFRFFGDKCVLVYFGL